MKKRRTSAYFQKKEKGERKERSVCQCDFTNVLFSFCLAIFSLHNAVSSFQTRVFFILKCVISFFFLILHFSRARSLALETFLTRRDEEKKIPVSLFFFLSVLGNNADEVNQLISLVVFRLYARVLLLSNIKENDETKRR